MSSLHLSKIFWQDRCDSDNNIIDHEIMFLVEYSDSHVSTLLSKSSIRQHKRMQQDYLEDSGKKLLYWWDVDEFSNNEKSKWDPKENKGGIC